MRISDWSSDVCSSDLPQEPLGIAVGGGDGRAVLLADHLQVGGAEPSQRPVTGLAEQRDRGVEGGLVDGRDAHGVSLTGGAGPVIGSAPWREGVCQSM